MAGKAGCHQKEYRCESRTPRIGAAAAVLNCMTDWAKSSTRGRKTAGVQRLGHAGTCTEPWLWAGKGIRWSSSGAITRQHGSVAALPHRLRVCRPRLSNQGACISLQKAQCAAMLDAACCDDHRSALRRHMHRVAFFGPMFSVCSQSRPYGSTRPGTPTLQSRSCILHILFHWGKEHNRRFRAFLSIVQRKRSKSLTRPSPLPKESSPNHQQVTPLCSKKTSRSAAKPHSLCPKKFYQQSAHSASLPQAIVLSVKAKPLEAGKAGGLPYLGWVCHRLIALLPHPARRNPSAKATGRESKRIYLVPKRSDCELMRAASSK